MERFEKYKRNTSYLYLGLFLAGIAFMMIVESIYDFTHGGSLLLQLTSLGGGIFWGIGAFICMRFYYTSNRAEINSLDKKTDTSEKTDKK